MTQRLEYMDTSEDEESLSSSSSFSTGQQSPATPTTSSYECTACRLSFRSTTARDNHQCSEEPWIPCLLCNSAYYRTRLQLQNHLKNTCIRLSHKPTARKRKRTQIYNQSPRNVLDSSTIKPSQLMKENLNQTYKNKSIEEDLYLSDSSTLSMEHIENNLSQQSVHQQQRLQDQGNIKLDSVMEESLAQQEQNQTDKESMLLVESALKGYAKTYQITCSNKCEIDVKRFLEDAVPLVESTLRKELTSAHGVKYTLWLEADYTNPTGETTEVPRNFKTSTVTIYRTTSPEDVRNHLQQGIAKLQSELQEHEGKGSGWTMNSVRGLQLRISKCNFFSAEKHVKLPKAIALTRSCINVKNSDSNCFRYAILSKHYEGNKNEILPDELNNIKHEYDFKNLSFPVGINDVKKFEQMNSKTSVNIFVLDKQNKIFPLKIVDKENEIHFDLLVISDPKVPENKHYVYIKNFEKLIRNQLTKDRHRITICKRCFSFVRTVRCRESNWLQNHQTYCNTFKPAQVILPTDENNVMTFKNISHHYKVPIVIYADIESTLAPISQCENNPIIFKSGTEKVQKHEMNSFALLVKSNLPDALLSQWDIPTTVQLCREENAAYILMTRLRQIAQNIGSLYKTNVPMFELTHEEQKSYDLSVKCTFCERSFSETVKKVRDHCHLTGRYRAAYCENCNLNLKVPKFVPIVFHNLAGYDSQFLIRVLGMFKSRVSIIPSSSEKFISFSVFVENIELRFLDSLKFTGCSLENLVNMLPPDELKETSRMINDPSKIDLCLRKGVYCYDYIDSTERFAETKLPPIESFYNKLTDTHITQEDYLHAQQVWKTFNLKTLGQYHDLYLKLDVSLLCDVMESFRNVCFKNYHLDPFHSYTSPGLSWNAMLKKTQVQLQLITDYDQYLFIESAVRGGFCVSNLRFAQANNISLENPEDYDPEKPTSHILYYDCTNLYGTIMYGEKLPYAGFKWVDDVNKVDIFNVPEDSPVGYLVEADVEYGEELHDKHNDLPLLPKNEVPPNGTTKKLLATLNNKTSYVAHHKIFAQAQELGLKVTNIKRILQFDQADWLKTYVELNTRLRQQAKNEFEKTFFKLMTNSIYGKSCQNQKKQINIKLVTTEKEFAKESSKVNFLDRTIIAENLVAVHLGRHRIELNRPLYIGQSILDLSKHYMFGFHYNVMLKHFDDIVLIYSDTDSLVYFIKTPNLNETLAKLAKYFDFSSYPEDHPLRKAHLPENTKRLGVFKDETSGRQIQEQVSLKSKMYSFRFNSKAQQAGKDVQMKAKGVKASALKNQILFDNYKSALFENKKYFAKFSVIRSRNHIVYTEKMSKLALSAFDDKRYILEDGIHTLAYGHYLLKVSKNSG